MFLRKHLFGNHDQQNELGRLLAAYCLDRRHKMDFINRDWWKLILKLKVDVAEKTEIGDDKMDQLKYDCAWLTFAPHQPTSRQFSMQKLTENSARDN